MKKIISIIMVLMLILSCTSNPNPGSNKMKHASILAEEYIYDETNAPTPECHASTIVESDGKLLVAWFGGTKEKNKDVGIWLSSQEEGNWSKPVEVANGIQDDGTRYPCWNPVLFQPKDGPLYLYYKVGPNPREWWGLYLTSEDAGNTWSEPVLLAEGILGPIKNKPVQLSNGDILSPTSTEMVLDSTEIWKIQLERSTDLGKTWTTSGDLNDGIEFGAIQPTILSYGDGKLQLLSRTLNEVITENWSTDNGVTWSKMKAISLPNPNSGIDAVTLADGRQLLVYNPTDKNWGDRVPLSIALSTDGKQWNRILDLEPVTNPETTAEEEYSYPGVIQTEDSLVHIIYTWNRKTVKHVVLDPSKLSTKKE